MKTIIAGSRSITDLAIVLAAVTASEFKISEVVSGGAAGVDRLGEWFAASFGIPIRRFPADWDGLGRRAGFIRNWEMAHYADALIAVWDGKSKGTKQMIEAANFLGLKVYVHEAR